MNSDSLLPSASKGGRGVCDIGTLCWLVVCYVFLSARYNMLKQYLTQSSVLVKQPFNWDIEIYLCGTVGGE